jgi:cyclase
MNQLSGFQSKHFALHQLAEGVFAASAQTGGAAFSNAGIVDLGDQSAVFDTFLTPQAALELRQCAEELTGHGPQIVINSHYHHSRVNSPGECGSWMGCRIRPV